MTPPFVPILLVGNISLVEACQRLRGALVAANLEADFCAVMDWLRFVLVCSAPDALSHLVKAEPTDPLANAVLLRHSQAVLIHDLPGLDTSVRLDTGSMIAANIRT